MLRGTFTFQGSTLHLFGSDVNNTVLLLGYTADSEDRLAFDSGWPLDPSKVTEEIPGEATGAIFDLQHSEPPRWTGGRLPGEETLFLSVGLSNISVEQIQDEGRPNKVNKEAFSLLGSIIRGMKSSCSTTRREDFLDLDFNEFSPDKETSYVIPDKGTVRLKMGEIVHMEYSGTHEGEDVHLILASDDEVFRLGYKADKNFTIGLKLKDFSDEDEMHAAPSSGEFYTIEEIIKHNPTKNYSWLLGQDYRIIEKDQLPWLKDLLLSHEGGPVAFDTETTGLSVTFKALNGEGDRLVGLVFSVKVGQAFYVPLRHRLFDNVCEEHEIQDVLEEFFKEVLETKPILCHNGSFDWRVMWLHEININLRHDTMVLYQLSLKNKKEISSVSLKVVTRFLLGRDSLNLSDFVDGNWGDNAGNFRDLYKEGVRLYACADTDNTLALYLYALENDLFRKYGMTKVYDIECLFSIAVGYQEFYGHCADMDRLEDLEREVVSKMESAQEELNQMAGYAINLNSPPQRNKFLFEDLGYPVVGRTGTGAPSSNKDALKKLASSVTPDGVELYPAASLLLQHGEVNTLYKNFISKLSTISTRDGFMFTRVNQFLETGRVSVSEPNYQSYDDTVKKYIIPREGFYMMDADYSAVEYRVLASMSKEQRLIDEFFNPDTDYHTFQASRMFGVPFPLVTKDLRQQAKGINFGLPYGMGDQSLGAHIYGSVSDENTRKAATLRKKYFEGQDRVRAFFDNVRDGGVRDNYASTFFGRRRYFDPRVLNSSDIRRQAGNHPIQGTSADLYKIAVGRLFNQLSKNDLLGKVLLTAFVHDELVLEVHKNIDPIHMLKMLRKAMLINLPDWCPLFIGVGFGTSWYQAKKTEIPILLQSELEERFGDTGLPWWDGDTEELYRWEVQEIFHHLKRRVVDYLNNPENTNTVVDVSINSLTHDLLDGVISGSYTDGVVDSDVPQPKEMVATMNAFGQAFGLQDLVDLAKLRDPDATVTVADLTQDEEDDFEEETIDVLDLRKQQAVLMGYAFSSEDEIFILNLDVDPARNGLLVRAKGLLVENPGHMKVLVVLQGELRTTDMTVNSSGVSKIMSLYRLVSH